MLQHIILGSLLGFFSSALPEILGFFRESNDRQHELLILDRQLEQQRQGYHQRLDEIQTLGDIANSQALYTSASQPTNTWVDALRASVRPVLTYAFFTLFAIVKLSAMTVLMREGGLSLELAIVEIWDEEAQALFAAIISFWFGNRALQKYRTRGA